MANIWSTAVSYADEEAGSLSESYNDDLGLMSASITLRTPYAQRHTLVQDVVGNRRPWPKGAAGTVPLAATAGIVPVITPGDGGAVVTAAANGEIIYGEALVTINYTTKIVDTYSESIEPNVEFLTLDHRWFRWSPYTGPIGLDVGSGSGGGTAVYEDYDPIREEEAPGRQMYSINYVKTNLNQTSLSLDLVDLVGTTNVDVVTWSSLGLTSPAETLLYLPPQITIKHDSSGATKYDVVKKFNYNRWGYNKFFRPATGNFHFMYLAGQTDPYRPYPLATFMGILV